MKKKLLLIILLFLMIIPIMVNADSCNTDKISISSIALEEKSDDIVEIEEATADGKNINLNLSMSEVGDNIKYKIVLNNDSDNDYELNEDTFNLNSDYIDYIVETEDNSDVVEANSSKVVYLNIEYKTEVPEEEFASGVYKTNTNMKVNILSNSQETIENPNTKTQSYIFILLIILVISLSMLRKKKISRFVPFVIGSIVFFPIAYALCSFDIEIESNIQVIKNDRIITYSKNNPDAEGEMDFAVIKNNTEISVEENKYVLDGFEFVEWNTKEDGSGDSYKPNDTLLITDNITLYAIWRRSETIYWALKDLDNDNINETLVLASHSAEGNIVGSFHEDTAFTKAAQVPWVNADGWTEGNLSRNVTNVIIENDIYPKSTAYWFYGVGYNATTFEADLYKLHTEQITNMASMFVYSGRVATTWKLNGIENFNTSNVTNMSSMFSVAGGGPTDLHLDLSSFDTSNVEAMGSMFSNFGGSAKTYEIKGLEDFDVSKVSNMRYMFDDFLVHANNWNFDFSKWNTSNLKEMNDMFAGAGRYSSSLKLNVTNWDVSNVSSFNYLFHELGMNSKSWSLIGLDGWDTSNVRDMTRALSNAGWNASSFILNLANWDTSNVTDMFGMFESAGYWAKSWSIGNINNWDVSNVEDMASMFTYAGGTVYRFNLDLSSWNTSKVKSMDSMFECAGNYSDYVNIDISGFDMSNVTDVDEMFGAYSNTIYYTWKVTIPKTNGAGIANSTTIINGKEKSFDVTSDYGLNKNNARFTLAKN